MARLAPKPGDTCTSCAELWVKQGQPRRKLVQIGSTQNKKMIVAVCPYCDGERAISIKKPKA